MYEYDDVFDEQGNLLIKGDRVVRAVTTHDSEWTAEDLAYAQAHRRNELDTCPGCGFPLSETTDPENEGAYESPLPARCHACTPLEHRKFEYRESPPGLLFRVFKRIEQAIRRS
ncbi:MAG: hypothetical protein ABR585_07800 [Gemmatimonadaceae bacterium]